MTESLSHPDKHERSEVIHSLHQLMQSWGNNQLYLDARAVVFRAWRFLTVEERTLSHVEHKPGCPALGGYGTADRECICVPSTTARSGETPVAWAIVEAGTNDVISAFPDELAAISARPSMDHDTIPLYAAPVSAIAPKWHRTGVKLPAAGQTVLAYWEFSQEPHPSGESNYGVVIFSGSIWYLPEDDEQDFRPPEWWAALPAAPGTENNSPDGGKETNG